MEYYSVLVSGSGPGGHPESRVYALRITKAAEGWALNAVDIGWRHLYYIRLED
jgi:hypothetical protein